MFTLVHLDSPPPESLNSQVLQMVVDYLSDISPVSLTPSNPLYQLYQYVIGYEMHLYLRAMDSAQPSSARLILALSDQDPSQVLGFALYLPAQDAPDACTLAYMAVQASQRRHGIARAMLAVQDLAPIFQSSEVRQIHAYLLKQHGKRAMSDAEKQRDRLLDQMAQQAQALVRERLTVH